MQRLLVGLVLFLTAAVGVLAVTTYNLYGELDRAARRPSAAQSRAPVTAGVPAERVETLEQRMSRVVAEIDKLQRDSQRLAREAALARRAAGSPGEAGEPDGDTSPLPSPGLDPVDRPRDADGDLVITDQDEEFFVALQKRVERRRRIEGMTRNVMRRIETLEQKGEIAQLSDDTRTKVEEVLHRYVLAGDDLVTRYVREPDPGIADLTPDQKRDEMAKYRQEIVTQAQTDLEALLGATDANAVGERCLRAYGGWRRNERPGVRVRRGG